ncbi:MAG: hypothetical protein ACI8QZ_002091 [Chlamydiales bacterium]|jgi:hypothetical protein
MTEALTEFRSSLVELGLEAQLKKQGRRPLPPVDRPLLRRMLLLLGELLETDPGGADDLSTELGEDLATMRKCITQLGSRWDSTLVGEMQLACTEHIQGVDARYMSHPRFDFEYVVEARQRLEMRLSALEALGQPVDEELMQRVAQADQRLADALRERCSDLDDG